MGSGKNIDAEKLGNSIWDKLKNTLTATLQMQLSSSL